MTKFRKGQKVLYWAGHGRPEIVKITGIKKNKPGTPKLVQGMTAYNISNGFWGYSPQFKKIPTKPKRRLK